MYNRVYIDNERESMMKLILQKQPELLFLNWLVTEAGKAEKSIKKIVAKLNWKGEFNCKKSRFVK
mgnify:CR=1 FL=1|jgi:hypothetical protein|nr:MAG TPA: hypothetical protein [Bacteriophage sp.]